MTGENFVNGINFDNLTEKELKEINRVSQEILDSIQSEKRRKAELKKNYALKEVPSVFHINQSRLGFYIQKHFVEDGQETLTKEVFEEYLKKSTDEIKPKREEVYSCPYCGEYTLRVGDFGDNIYSPKRAVTCENCDFTVKKKTDGKEYYAWEIFHEWLVKHGYLDENVKFNY